jgi:predicted nucleotidyltransferase
MTPSLEQLLPCLRAQMPGVLADRPVMLAYLYGSVADGSALPFSDVDIALVLEPHCPLSAYERMLLELDIASEVERGCGVQKADVRSVDLAPLTVRGTVVTDGRLLYSRDETFRVEYEVYTRKLYFDFLPVVRMMRHAYFDHMGAELRRQGVLAGG